VGGLIFTRYLWAFELTSALLITAALGAMVLTLRLVIPPSDGSADRINGSLVTRTAANHEPR
jgi:hypothetical protein